MIYLLCSVVLVSAEPRCGTAMCIRPCVHVRVYMSTPSLSPAQVVTGTELSPLCCMKQPPRTQPPTSCFMHSSVSVSTLIWFVPPSPSPMSTSPFMSASLFLSCKWVHVYCFLRSHIFVLIYDICFSFRLTSHFHNCWSHCQSPTVWLIEGSQHHF